MTETWRPTATRLALTVRADMLRTIRNCFDRLGMLEVETPTLSHAGGTDVALASIEARVGGTTCYLQTSPEFAMKRLLAAGYGDIWQIARAYRDHESGRLHNPEFTLIEWYRVGLDHHALMREVDGLVRAALADRRSLAAAQYLTYRAAYQRYAGVDPFAGSIDDLAAALSTRGIDVPDAMGSDRDGWLDLLMSTVVGPQLGKTAPTFIYDFPASQAALARREGVVAARFELFLDGIELANGFHELTDAAEQHSRFDVDIAMRTERGLPLPRLDTHLLAALEHGLPACAGVALGFDRLVMRALGTTHIDDVIAFPFARA
jgi:lysyl-tRNA synthetase class 2